MKKNISKEQIIDITLELMREKENLKELNLRTIARTLGCAHTNLYNYFSSYTDLLWHAHVVLQEKCEAILEQELQKADSSEQKLYYFFKTFVDFYLDNKGWFRFMWLEYIGDDRPEYNVIATKKATAYLKGCVSYLWKEYYQKTLDEEKIMSALHTVHCYIIGEVSNYFAGRLFIADKNKLKERTINHAMHVLKCLLEDTMEDSLGRI